MISEETRKKLQGPKSDAHKRKLKLVWTKERKKEMSEVQDRSDVKWLLE